jgi:hypothetical protein
VAGIVYNPIIRFDIGHTRKNGRNNFSSLGIRILCQILVTEEEEDYAPTQQDEPNLSYSSNLSAMAETEKKTRSSRC